MTLKKRIIALFLTLALALSLCGCGFVERYIDNDSASAFYVDDSLRQNAVKFEDLKYTRPDMKALKDKAAEVSKSVEGSSPNKVDVVNSLNDFFDMYSSFSTMYTLAYIRYDLDTGDEFYEDEYSYCSEQLSEVDSLYDKVLSDCANSSVADYLDKNYFSGMLAENYTDDGSYTPDEELLKLYRREAELSRDYDDLYVKMNSDSSPEYEDYYNDAAKLYIELIKVRHKIADRLGYDSYEEYAFEANGRDYTADQLDGYIKAIKQDIVPLYKKALENDLYSTYYNALYAIDADEALRIVTDTVVPLSPDIKNACNFMLKYKMYDVSDSSTKYNQSYVTYLDNYDAPFLFSAPGGYEDDVLTFGHEFGHYIDGYLNYNTDTSLDTSEVFSQGMEYLLLCNIEDKDLAQDLTNYKLMDAMCVYIDQTSFAEFEKRAYALPESALTADKLYEIYSDLAEEYGFSDEYGKEVGMLWINIPHLFSSPFYVISYCVSDSAAFELYNLELSEKGAGLKKYMELMADAPDYGFLDLMKKHKLGSPISADTIANIAATFKSKLEL